ncbi:hypothetical protein D9757_000089 [Collybiopsis confluens]|uniref:MFS general substrate transporter n=1 Tax=Collybiopsis confluens TaxID=2823264 RepID=A0A8H5I2H9_9AGAR|nr:hypothetical protein D9757_000089 [Collybiopsis confluens]
MPSHDGYSPLGMRRHERTSLLRYDSDLEALLAHPEDRKELERRLLRKLDTRMSILVLIYVLNYIDRQNIAVARLQGFEKDLRLEGSQYASCLGIVYVGYLFMQIPSIYGQAIHIPINLHDSVGLYVHVDRFHDVLFARLVLGCLEAPFFSGALLLIARWYRRDEIGQRTAWLACGLLIANATGSLIASGILKVLESVPGISAWRGLFISEGALTVSVALCAMYILPDFPKTSSSWLSPLEQALAVQRIREDTASNDSLDIQRPIHGLWLAVSDWKVWWLTAILAVYAFASSFHFYFPTLVQTIGYGPVTTLLLSVPPWLTAIVVVILVSRHSDHRSERFFHISLSILVGVVGYVVAISTMNPLVRYVSFFAMTQIHAAYTCFMAWASCSVSEPANKRTTALAIINTGGIAANILVSFAWPSNWGPDYTKSFGICVFAALLTVVMSWTFRRYLERLNERETEYQYQL